MKSVEQCIKENDVKSLKKIYDENYINQFHYPFAEFILTAGFQTYLKENPSMTLLEISKLIDFSIKNATKKESREYYKKRYCRYSNFDIDKNEHGCSPLILCVNDLTATLPNNPIIGAFYSIRLGENVATGALVAPDNYPFYGEGIFDGKTILKGQYNTLTAIFSGKEWLLR
jgi:hypothetical protein